MQRIVYVNGAFLPEQEAKVSIFDRGFLFADGVYEVTAVLEGTMLENDRHLKRLRRSLAEIDMRFPLNDQEITAIQQELLQRNRLKEGIIYIQITRGCADRDFTYPSSPQPTMIAFTQEKSLLDAPLADRGIRIITTLDNRWGRPDIKTVCLLASSMAKMQALQAGKDDAWFVDDRGFITEATASNAYILTADNTLVTRHLSRAILPGITRQAILELAARHNIRCEERPFTVAEAQSASEAFMTGSAAFVIPVVEINNHLIGSGTPGLYTRKLRELYIEKALYQRKS